MGKLRGKKKPAPVKFKKPTKPLTAGTIDGIEAIPVVLPKGKIIKRYILTSAQNNTILHEGVWQNIKAFAASFNPPAEIFVGTFTYNKNAYGEDEVKRETFDSPAISAAPYPVELMPYILVSDKRMQLGDHLVWCGEANIIPTTSDPLARFETFAGRQSCIFPHAKIAMRSVAATEGNGAKLIYTTGTVTMNNYIQKRAGLLAEFHHTYGGLIVEVGSEGIWKVRQLNAETKTGTFYDLDLKVENGVVTDKHRVEAIVFGDLHATIVDPTVLALSATAPGNMIDVLKPKFVFIHDLIEGASVNHHGARKPMDRFNTDLRGFTSVEKELQATADVLKKYDRPDLKLVIVNSNHDRWLDRWLDEFDPKFDAACNLEIYHDGNSARLQRLRLSGERLNVLEYLLQEHTDLTIDAKFLKVDESFTICDNQIECGQHGDLGPNGSRGTAQGLAKVGRRAIIGHSHTAGIWDGLYSVGTSTEFRMGYNVGPSSWTHSHCVVYENGKRAIITMYKNAWKA